MKLWLVRHAQPLVDAGVCYGRLDVAADPAATRASAQALAQALPLHAVLHTSPLQRCERLARTLCTLRPDLASKTDDRLAEMDFGSWEGQRWDALGAHALDAWTQDFAHHPPGGGESVNHVMQRVAQALDSTRNSGQDTVWVTHACLFYASDAADDLQGVELGGSPVT